MQLLGNFNWVPCCIDVDPGSSFSQPAPVVDGDTIIRQKFIFLKLTTTHTKKTDVFGELE
jgi:hypothetical protein